MKITLLYQVSHYIRVEKQRNIKSWDQQNNSYKRVLLYQTSITRFHCILKIHVQKSLHSCYCSLNNHDPCIEVKNMQNQSPISCFHSILVDIFTLAQYSASTADRASSHSEWAGWWPRLRHTDGSPEQTWTGHRPLTSWSCKENLNLETRKNTRLDRFGDESLVLQWNLIITRSLGPWKLPCYIRFLISG